MPDLEKTNQKWLSYPPKLVMWGGSAADSRGLKPWSKICIKQCFNRKNMQGIFDFPSFYIFKKNLHPGANNHFSFSQTFAPTLDFPRRLRRQQSRAADHALHVGEGEALPATGFGIGRQPPTGGGGPQPSEAFWTNCTKSKELSKNHGTLKNDGTFGSPKNYQNISYTYHIFIKRATPHEIS